MPSQGASAFAFPARKMHNYTTPGHMIRFDDVHYVSMQLDKQHMPQIYKQIWRRIYGECMELLSKSFSPRCSWITCWILSARLARLDRQPPQCSLPALARPLYCKLIADTARVPCDVCTLLTSMQKRLCNFEGERTIPFVCTLFCKPNSPCFDARLACSLLTKSKFINTSIACDLVLASEARIILARANQ